LKDITNATILNRYDGYFVTTKSFKESQRDLCMSLYGVPSRLEASEILSKIEKTNIAKYGKSTFAGSDQHVRSLDYVSISEKAWRTKIRNGSCSKSLPEEMMNQYLVDFYGVSNVQRQVKVLTQWVDFYVPIIDTFIQVDGVYWHGLNRSAEVIKLQKTSQDKKIYKQVLRDERLNMYCKDNGIKLIRITDNDIRVKTKEEIYAML
jgi:G:T-mismatch repair DNA endonuclease (very short patch repair protein)